VDMATAGAYRALAVVVLGHLVLDGCATDLAVLDSA